MSIAESFCKPDPKRNFAAWSYKVLQNKIVDYYRRRGQTHHETPLTYDHEAAALHQQPKPEFKMRLLKWFRNVLEDYPRRARAMNLFYQGYTIDEICEKLQLSRTGVYILLSRSRSKLRSCMNEEDEEL